MIQVELNAWRKTVSGKEAARKLRKQGKVPAVVYGRTIEPIPIALDFKQFLTFVKSGKTRKALIKLKFEGGLDVLEKETIMVKDVQLHHIRREPLSADFVVVYMNEEIEVDVPIHFEGTPVGVSEGGVIQYLRRKIPVRCLPTNIPELIVVNVSEIKLGHSLHLKDVSLPKGVTILLGEDEPLAVVSIPKGASVIEEVKPAAEEVPAEGEEKAEGEQPKTDQKDKPEAKEKEKK